MEFNNLLVKYWPNFIIKHDKKELSIKNKLVLKDKILNDFSDWLNYNPKNRKRRSRMILRSYDSNQYPNTNNPDEFGEYSWFASELKSLYHNGIEFVTDIVTIQVFDDNSWNFPGNNKKLNGKLIGVMKVGQINFSDIVGYDIRGDEYYNCPHIYCKFRFQGTPFENYYFQDLEKSFVKFEYVDKRE